MAKQFGGQNNPAQHVTLEKGTCVETSLGQGIVVDGDAKLAQANVDAQGKLTLTFENGAMLIVSDYTSAKANQIQTANGKALPIEAMLADANGLANVETAAGAAQPNVITMPGANAEKVVVLEAGEEYRFDFSMTDPVSAKIENGALVITFKNGGEIIIPNYSEMTAAGSDAKITLADGAELTPADMYDTLAAAAQLNDVETAAGDAGGGSGGGFGFQSVFTATDFQGLDAIGPIAPTALNYQTFAREPLYDGVNLTPPSVSLTVNNVQVDEDNPIPLSVTTGPAAATEQTTVTITGITTGWTVDTSASGGTYNPATGTWTVTLAPGQSLTTTPTLTPPFNSDADLTGLVVTVTVTDSGTGLSTTVTGTMDVIVDAVADIPVLTVQPAVGAEDTAIPVTINAAPWDTDGSEEITSVVISDVPAGWTFNHGQDNGNGTWTLTTADLPGLTITPPNNYNGTTPPMTVTITTTEVNLSGIEPDLTDNSATTSQPLVVTVTPVADAPLLSVEDIIIYEDTSENQLSFTATLTDPTEHLTITITGFQPGWAVSTPNGSTFVNGVWSITLPAGQNFTADMAPSVVAPNNSDVDLNNLVITATSTTHTGNSSASTTDNFDILVDAVADTPFLTASTIDGNEGTWIPVTITAATADTDGSEEITSIFVTNLQEGVVFNHGGYDDNGNWVLTPADLAGLAIMGPYQASGMVLNVTIVTTEVNLSGYEHTTDNNTATTTQPLTINFLPVADAPELIVQNEVISEDGSGQVHIYANVHDQFETLTISISGFTPGWGVNTVNSGGTYNPATGTWTITLAQGESFAGGPIVTPPANSDADLNNLLVTATANVPGGQSTATVTGNFNIVVDAVADVPALTVGASTGVEDHSIPVTISTAVTDTDGSETITAIVISDLPPGTTFNHGQAGANSTWILTPAQLQGLTVTPPANFNGTMNMTVTTVATETNLSGAEVNLNDNTATYSQPLVVTVKPEAVTPTVGASNELISEDGSTAIHAFANVGSVNDTLTVTISGIQSSWTVNTSQSGGTYNAATGTWTITLPQGQNFVGGPIVTPAANSDADMNNLVITATASNNGTTASAQAQFNIVVDAVADAPALTVNAATGLEDFQPIAVNINTAVTDTDGSETITSIVISGVPAGATFNHGQAGANGTWILTPAQLPGLTVTPPANFSGTMNMAVTTTVTETNLSGVEVNYGNNTATTTQPLNVIVKPVAELPSIMAPNQVVSEDGSVQVTVSAHTNDPTDTLTTVSISGFAPGWTVNTSQSGGTYNAATGTWTLTLPAGQATYTGGPTVSPPANSDIDLNNLSAVAVAAPAGGTATTSTLTHFNIVVDAVADAPTLQVSAANGLEDHPIAVNIATAVTDTDGSETITSIVISGVPAGATFNHGQAGANGTWILTPAQLQGLTMTPPSNYSGTLNMTVTSTATETNLHGSEVNYANNTATATKPLVVTVTPELCAPNVSADNHLVSEDGSVQLVVHADVAHSNEVLTVTISGFAPGWTVNTSQSGGTYNAATGTWTITLPAGQDFHGGPIVSPPANSDNDLNNLVVTGTASVGGQSASATDNFNIVVDAVADVPTLQVGAASGNEDAAIAINISTAVTDTDGSETITKIVISGVPAGATFNHGQAGTNGTWVLTPAQLQGLTMTPPHNFNGTINMSVTTTATETNLHGVEVNYANNTATNTQALVVNISPVADKPNLTVCDEYIYEDAGTTLSNPGATLNIHAELTDPSEHLTITVSGITAGWGVNTSMSGGTYNAATGTWSITLPAGQNFHGGPLLTPPANSDADLTNLLVTATSTTATGNVSASTTNHVNIIVDAVADTPNLTVQDLPNQNWYYQNTGYSVALNISASVADTDGSEVITKIVLDLNNIFSNTVANSPLTNLDAMGIALNKGVEISPGIWEIAVNAGNTAAALAGLKLIVPNSPHNYHAIHQSITGGHQTSIGVTVHSAEVNLHGEEITYTNNTATATDSIDFKFFITPLVLDLDGNGITLVGQDAGVHFDMTNDGVLDSTTWVGGNDGLLALDLNHDGIINNQSELFGTSDTAFDGFGNLAGYDLNNDGVIDANDSVFSQLVVWQDFNMDGISQAGEMHSLSDLHIASISLNAVAAGDEQIADGALLATGTFTYENGQQGVIADALFNVDNGAVMDINDVLTPEDTLLFASVEPQPVNVPANQNLAYDSASIDIDALTNTTVAA